MSFGKRFVTRSIKTKRYFEGDDGVSEVAENEDKVDKEWKETVYDNGSLIFRLFLPLQYYYRFYHCTRIGPQLHVLQYLTDAAIRYQTADYEVEGSEPTRL